MLEFFFKVKERLGSFALVLFGFCVGVLFYAICLVTFFLLFTYPLSTIAVAVTVFTTIVTLTFIKGE